MTKTKVRPRAPPSKTFCCRTPTCLREVVRAVMQEVLEAEMTEALGAAEGRAHAGAAGLPLRLLRPDAGHAGRQAGAAGAAGPGRPLLDRAVRALPALGAGAGGDAWRRCTCRACRPGRSRRSPRSCAVTASRPRRSARSTSGWTRAWPRLPSARFAEPFPYLILDARYEKVREAGVIMSQAVLIAVGIDWDGRARCSASSWPTARAGRAGGTSCSG